MDGKNARESAGYFKEKAAIGLCSVTGSDIDKAILKATSHMLKAPKEKYVQVLLAASHGQTKRTHKNGRPVCEHIVRELEKRSHSHNWVVVLKSLITLHRLLCSASEELVQTLCTSYRGVFNPVGLKKLSKSSNGWDEERFIHDYMDYLSVLCSARPIIGFGRRIEAAEFDDYMSSLAVEPLLVPCRELLLQLSSLASLPFIESIVNNYCTLEAYQLIIQDGKHLFQLLSKRFVLVLNTFEELSSSLKQRWYGLFERFASTAEKLRNLFNDMQHSRCVFSVTIPRLKCFPPSILANLRQDITFTQQPVEVCSLESLGIKHEDVREPSASSELPVKEIGGEEATSQETVPQPSPQKYAITMDDLFEPTPQSEQGELDRNMNTFHTQFSHQKEPEPVDSNWTTGAPRDWHTSAQTSPYVAQLQVAPVVDPPAPAKANISNEKGKKDDPFKDLFDQATHGQP